MIENYLKLLEQDKPDISSEDEKEINLFKKLVLAGSQTAFDAVLEFSRRQQLGLYKDINFIIDPDALLIEVTDKKSPFKNKDVFDDAMIRILRSKYLKNQKFNVDERGSFFEDHNQYLFSKFPLLMFKQSFLENFENVCRNGYFEIYNTSIIEIIMIYGFEFLQFKYSKHKDLRDNLYFYGFLNTDLLFFFKGCENYSEIFDSSKNELNKFPMIEQHLPRFKSFKDEKEKETFFERDMQLYKNKWQHIKEFFLDTMDYSNKGYPSDYIFHFEKDKSYLPLALTLFGKYLLSNLISIIKQTNQFMKNELFEEPSFMSEEGDIRNIIIDLLPLCYHFESKFPELKTHLKDQEKFDAGGFDVGFSMRDEQKIDIEEEVQKKE